MGGHVQYIKKKFAAQTLAMYTGMRKVLLLVGHAPVDISVYFDDVL